MSVCCWGEDGMRDEMHAYFERVREEFPPPKYRVELHANDREMWVVNQETHDIVEIDEDEFALAGVVEEIEHIRATIG
jgi:hypothetical protein